MKKLTFLVAVLAVMGLAVTANAQFPYDGADIAPFVDATSGDNVLDLATTGSPALFVEFPVYIVAQNLTEIAAYEFVLTVPSTGFFVVGGVAYPAATSTDFASANAAFQAGTGGCVTDGSVMLPSLSYAPEFWPLGQVNLVLTAASNDISLCVTGYTGTAGLGVPAYTLCDDAGTKRMFFPMTDGGTAYADGCVVLNATSEAPVSAPESSFGSLKARY